MTTLVDNLSLAQQIALLPPDQQREALEGLDAEELLHQWSFWARPSQRQPEGDFSTWVYMAGRGAGKTRTAAEWIHERVRNGYAKRIMLLGRTSADVRDVMIHGPSGLLNTGRPDERPEYFPSKRLLVWPGGKAEALAFSADEPDQTRGPQGDTAWCVAEGSLVVARRGDVPIEQVVIGDSVMTRQGWRPVTATRRMGVKPVVRIATESSFLRCTEDHRVWVDGAGWVLASMIQPNDTVIAWIDKNLQKQVHRTIPCGGEFVGTTIRRTTTTETPVVTFSMLPSGNQLTGSAQRDRDGFLTFITSTTTKQTIPQTIWNSALVTSISSIIMRTSQRRGQKRNALRGVRLHGSDVPPSPVNASSATQSSSANLAAPRFTAPLNAAINGDLNIQNFNVPALSAERTSIYDTRTIRRSIVQRSATAIEEHTNAFIAESSSKDLISETDIVPIHVVGMEPVLSVVPDGTAQTYDITVQHAHEFFANGILVHNCDEFATFANIADSDGATAFDNLRLGLRLPVPGDMPRMILTTTPRRTPSMFKILNESENPMFGIRITRGTTYENLGNLADNFRATILGLYEGTRLGRQELLGEMLTDVDGALFMQEWFDAARVDSLPPGRMFAVVGVDPSVAERPRDECGIVVGKATMEKDFYKRHLYIVEDASVLGPPSVWAAEVARMARKWNAPIVAEGNQGGELVRMAIAQADSNLPVHIVHARTGKATRAEPVAALAQQLRLRPVGVFPELEDQSASWVPGETKKSPDRLDACVVSGSLIATDHGSVPVERLRPGSLVRTRTGFHRALGVELMGEDRPVVRVVTDRGSFTATPEHRVWTVGGRVQSSQVRVNDVVVVDGRPDRVVWMTPLPDGSLELLTLRGGFVIPDKGTVEVATGSWRSVDDLVPGMRGVWSPPRIGWFARWREPAPLAEFTVLRVEDAGAADVWDVMVEDEHEFFADGHLVHNCVWACLSLVTRQKGVSFSLGRHLRARSSKGRLPMLSAANLGMKRTNSRR